MKMIKSSFAGLLFATLLFSACKKNNEATKAELLSKQPWKLTAFIKKDLATGAEQDQYAPMSACYKDDQYVYKPDMSFEANAGATKCNAADPQVFQTGSWSFKNNETVLETVISTGTSAGSVFEYTISSISPTELNMHTIQGGYDYIFRFTH